jgi:hypothetical protein
MRTLHCRAANTAEPRVGCRHISSDGESHSNALLALPTRWSVRYLTTEGVAKPHSTLSRAWAGVVNRGRRAQDPGFRGLGEGFPRSFDVVMLADVLYYVPWGGPIAPVPAPLRAPAALLLCLCAGEPQDVRPCRRLSAERTLARRWHVWAQCTALPVALTAALPVPFPRAFPTETLQAFQTLRLRNALRPRQGSRQSQTRLDWSRRRSRPQSR